MTVYKPILSHLFGLTPDQVENMCWDDWLTYRAWADRHLTARQHGHMMAQHPAIRGAHG